jgi:ethanolamine ammonia-lyase small subunit
MTGEPDAEAPGGALRDPVADPARDSAQDPWARLRQATAARIGLGRSGDALPLKAVLDFQLAHAQARDAVHTALDVEALADQLAPLPVLRVRSAAVDRGLYLRRPDLGRRLAPECRELLSPAGKDVVFVIGDGLSARAVQHHAVPLLRECLERLRDISVAPVVIATQARVALGDEIGHLLGARLCAVLIGERPGLSVADSLGVYLTHAPKPGRADSERNCISNIHGAGGLSYPAAADKLVWLMRQALIRGLTGVRLKDDAGALPGGVAPGLEG